MILSTKQITYIVRCIICVLNSRGHDGADFSSHGSAQDTRLGQQAQNIVEQSLPAWLQLGFAISDGSVRPA